MLTFPSRHPQVLSVVSLLRPHWKAMTMAHGGRRGRGGRRELLEPWPLKIVLDNLLQDGRSPEWMGAVAGWFGGGRLAVLNVAVVAVAAIARGRRAEHLSADTGLTTNVGQWVMHDLRRTLYHHIHRLSLAEHDEKRTGDLIGRVTSDIESDPGLRHVGAARHPDQRR